MTCRRWTSRRRCCRIEQRTRYIAQMSDHMVLQIKRTEKIMLKAMFEAAYVTVPSCFIILNRDLNEVVPEMEHDTVMKKATRWTKNLAAIADAVDAVWKDGGKAAITSAIDDLLTGEVLWLNLMDEVTLEPVLGQPHYPIMIKKPSPLLKLGLTAVSALNKVSAIRCLGYPTPKVPESMNEEHGGRVRWKSTTYCSEFWTPRTSQPRLRSQLQNKVGPIRTVPRRSPCEERH